MNAVLDGNQASEEERDDSEIEEYLSAKAAGRNPEIPKSYYARIQRETSERYADFFGCINMSP